MIEYPAGTPGPHVFVESLDAMHLDTEDLAHLSKSLRMRDGDPLTASDGQGNWRRASFSSSGSLQSDGSVHSVPPRSHRLTIGFSLVKGSKPELVIQKLTELGIDRIVVLDAERSVVKWDGDKVDKAKQRWQRIVREAAMQSHQVRLPTVEALVPATAWLAKPSVAIAHFGGDVIGSSHTSIAIGPEGGWSDDELSAATRQVSLGTTVLRAETAAIAAGTMLTAASRHPQSDGG